MKISVNELWQNVVITSKRFPLVVADLVIVTGLALSLAAQSVVDGIDGEILQLQTELQQASPGEKPFIISEIKRLREEELPVAMAALEDARRALQACRCRPICEVL